MNTYGFSSTGLCNEIEKISRRRLLWRGGALAISPLALAVTAGCGSGGGDQEGGLYEPPPGSACAFWSTALKTVFLTVVTTAGDAALPGAGTLAGNVMGVLWPSCGTNAVDDVLTRADVISIDNQNAASRCLTQVKEAIASYKSLLTPSASIKDVKAAFEGCFDDIKDKDSVFQPSGDEVTLLPLYALYGHLYLSVVVDAQINAVAWGLDSSSPWIKAGPAFLARAVPYVKQMCEWSYMSKIGDSDMDAINYHDCQPFRRANEERTRLYTDVLDISVQWPAIGQLGVTKPSTDGMINPREIFYGPYGTGDASGVITLPMTSATEPPLSISINSGIYLDAVQATYSPGAGPDGATTTPKMGDNGGGHTNVTSANTINGCTVWSGDIVNGIKFNYSSGDTTSLLGGTNGTQHDVTPNDSLLSSVYVNGVSTYYGSADTFVVGFVQDPAKIKPGNT